MTDSKRQPHRGDRPAIRGARTSLSVEYTVVRILVTACVVLGVALVSGCASTVRSGVVAFHDWPADATPRTYRFVRTPEQKDSLQHTTEERLLRDELARAGFVEDPQGRFEVTFNTQVQTRIRRIVEQPPPMAYSSLYFGHFVHGASIGMSFPLSYPWGPYPVERDVSVQERRLTMQIVDGRAQPPRRVYEATATSLGDSADLSTVLPYMARAILDGFPGPSGGPTRTIDIPVDPTRRG